MINTSVLVVLACFGYFLVIQNILPMTVAVRVTPNVDGFRIENHRTRIRTRPDYLVQRALEDKLSENLDVAASDVVDFETSPDELSSQIDYANMIRNNVIFLDNSVETMTRKRGNMKKKNHIIADGSCNCESEIDTIELGDNYNPKRVVTRRCLEGSCPKPYRCTSSNYSVTVQKITTSPRKISARDCEMSEDLCLTWEAEQITVTAACFCATADSIKYN